MSKSQADPPSSCFLSLHKYWVSLSLISYLSFFFFVLISIFLSCSAVKKCQYEDEKDGNKPRCSLYEHGQISSFNLTLAKAIPNIRALELGINFARVDDRIRVGIGELDGPAFALEYLPEDKFHFLLTAAHFNRSRFWDRWY